MGRVRPSRGREHLFTCAVLSLLLVVCPGPAAAAPAGVSAATAAADGGGFVAAARTVRRGGRLTLTGLQLEGQKRAATLELERAEVWSRDAQIVIHGPGGSKRVQGPPATAYFRGSTAGDPHSHALLAVGEDGSTRGMALSSEQAHAIGKPRGRGGALRSRRIVPAESAGAASAAARARHPYACGDAASQRPPAGHEPAANVSAPGRRLQQFVRNQRLVATIAVETDWEFYQLFYDTAALADYVGDLLGYADLVFSREVGVDLQIGRLNVYTTPADPYASNASEQDLLKALSARWGATAALRAVPRTTVLYLSPKTRGANAYIGTNSLCGWYDDRNGGASYAFAGFLRGNHMWSEDQAANPAAFVWDAAVTMHELGHNFNAPHTHDACGLGGIAEPVDRCVAGCKAAAGLPTCNPNKPTPFFHTAGDKGEGTLMSYCHLVKSYKFGNQAATFGKGHNCGVKPGRIPAKMQAYLQERAAIYPACFGVNVMSPPPSPPSPPSPPPQRGSLANPVDLPALAFPWTSSASALFFTEASMPLDTTCAAMVISGTPYPTRVFRWYSSLASGQIVADTCGSAADVWLSVVSTPSPGSNEWRCEGFQSDAGSACGANKLAVKWPVAVEARRWYYFIVRLTNQNGPTGFVRPSFRLRVTAPSLQFPK